MENKTTIEYGSGTLYFMPPEGGDPVAVGQVNGLTETIEQEHRDHPLTGPLVISTTQTFSFEADLEQLSLPKLWRLTGDPIYLVRWAKQNHPRLFHLTCFAKTGRRRARNTRRLAIMFVKEAFA
jgi:hypothetical protein